MFGLFRKKPAPPPPPSPPEFRLVPFSEAKPRLFTSLLCDGLTAQGLSSFVELMALQARLQTERPDVRVLASLDDLHQAAYTSGHGIDTHDLDDAGGHDLSRLDPEVFEDGEHRGYLSTPSEFPIRLANLRKPAKAVRFDDLRGRLYWQDEFDLVELNRDPEPALRIAGERDVVFQFAPVADAADALAAFPNGYFTDDLDPFQNHAVARRLEEAYGLALIGVGSRYLGFRRQEAFDGETARRAAAAVVALYSEAPVGATEALADILTGRDWLLFRYTGG